MRMPNAQFRAFPRPSRESRGLMTDEQMHQRTVTMAMLDPRADESEIRTSAFLNARRVEALLRRTEATDAATLRGQLETMAVEFQAGKPSEAVTLAGLIARMREPAWWTRRMRRELLREAEAGEHAAGNIRRKKQVYVSDFSVKRTIARAKTNRKTLERMEAVNGLGEVINLLDASDASVSNPKKRRAELMTRCRGFEEMARYMNHQAVFLTLTAPSRFHRFDGAGQPNKRWNGAEPKDGHKYLNQVWTRIRSAWKKAGIYPYGFRVVEPHHDGCPHWHVLLFVPPQHVGWFNAGRYVAGKWDHGTGMVGIAGAHTLADNSGEPGAWKNRFQSKLINDECVTDERGGKTYNRQRTATGYIAKYISKNIDGLTEAGDNVGLDFASGKRANEAAARVRSWAGLWNIRQFQQIGGPSVTVYRELRRLGKDLEKPVQLDLFEHPRAAADRALWALFWMLQGGPDVPRSELSLRPMYEDAPTRYGDVAKRVKGVEARAYDHEVSAGDKWAVSSYSQARFEHQAREVEGVFSARIVTRLHEWTVQRAGLAAINSEAEARRLSPRSGEAAQPWTGVNNCTDDDDEAAYLASSMAEFDAAMAAGVVPPFEQTDFPGEGSGVLPEMRNEKAYRTPAHAG